MFKNLGYYMHIKFDKDSTEKGFSKVLLPSLTVNIIYVKVK